MRQPKPEPLRCSATECFWCPCAGTILVNGVALCESHAMCTVCLRPLALTALTCRCEHEGYVGHEEYLYCSERCLEAGHPDYDPGPVEEEEDQWP